VTGDIHAAAAAGDAAAVARILSIHPELATAVQGKEAWPPLAFACASTLHQGNRDKAAGLLDVVDRLLAAGASPNSFTLWFDESGKSFPIPVLYYACMSDHVAVVARLLERGANTQDGESIYHAAEHNRRACLELMAAHGADFSSRQSPYGNTPLFFLAGHRDDEGGRAAWAQGVRWLLDHGADPNVTSGDDLATPLHVAAAGGRHQVLQWLVDFGADPNARRRDGMTPYRIAVRSGNEEGAAFLIERGASADAVPPNDRFLGACLAGDLTSARRLLERDPHLMATITGELEDGGTPLHWAAWHGRPRAVEALLALGADPNIRDSRFGSSPLGWTAHGSQFARDDDQDRFLAIVDRLEAAGATREAAVNKWGQLPENMASPKVKQRLIGG
jgi:ankyrin repeat protein